MSEKPLLLSPARQAVLVVEPRWATWLRYAAIAIGIFVVLVGLADLTSRAAAAVLGENALFEAFAPAAARPSRAVVPSAAATSSVIVPARINVPALGIDAKVEEVGTNAAGAMATPKDFMQVGWWSEGQKPGQEGNAVFAGHVNNALTTAGVFANLSKIRKGDYVTVSDAQGRTQVYRVEEISLYNPDEAPLEKIFARKGPSQLVLITCEGEWIEDERQYDQRLVVIARPAY